MKTVSLRSLLVLLALWATSIPVHANQPPDDPIIGKWTWVMNQDYEFRVDGTFHGDPGLNGTWEYISGDAVREYHLHFERQKDVEKVELERGHRKDHAYGTGHVYRLRERFEVKKNAP